MPKVMLIEDDRVMLSLLSTLLKLEGYDIAVLREDGEAAIVQAICSSPPDLVLMDVNLRGANGLSILRQVRQHLGCQNVRFLMSSGMDVRKDCLESGADDFILKPYMPEDLLQKMRALIAV